MSFRLAADVLDYAPYSGGTLLVLLAMASWANDDGTRIYPSVKALSEKARLSIRQTQNALRELETDGTITVVTPGGGRKVTEYRIEVQKLHPRKNCTPAKNDAEDVANCTPAVQSATAHIETLSSEPINEPTNARVRADERDDRSGSRKRNYPDPFERIWTEFRKCPGFQSEIMPKGAVHDAWLEVRDALPPTGDVVARIRDYARFLERQNARRPASDPYRMKHPARWLRDRNWDTDDGETANTPRAMTLKTEHADLLRAAGFDEAVIAAWLGECEFDAGPPAVLYAPSESRGPLIDRHVGLAKIARALGVAELTVAVKQERAA